MTYLKADKKARRILQIDRQSLIKTIRTNIGVVFYKMFN